MLLAANKTKNSMNIEEAREYLPVAEECDGVFPFR